MKKKLLTVLVALVLCISLTAILVACGDGDFSNGPGSGSDNPSGNTPGGGDNPGGGTDTPVAKPMSTTKLVAFSAATTGNMLYSLSGAGTAGIAAAAADTTGNLISDEEIDAINEQIKFIESFIGSNPMQTEQVTPVDKPGYEFQLKISTTDLAGNTLSYMMYFNQTAGETEIEDADDDDDDDDEVDELETEQSFSLNGLMVVGEKEYTLIGEKKTETEGNESETELELTAIDAEKLNKIEFIQESEQEGTENEQEFTYTIYSRDNVQSRFVKVKSFSLELENENGEQEIELKSSDAANGSLRFEKETENGKTVIKVVQKKGTDTKVIKVRIEGNKYIYYIDGQKAGERDYTPVIPPEVTEPTVDPNAPTEPTVDPNAPATDPVTPETPVVDPTPAA